MARGKRLQKYLAAMRWLSGSGSGASVQRAQVRPRAVRSARIRSQGGHLASQADSVAQARGRTGRATASGAVHGGELGAGGNRRYGRLSPPVPPMAASGHAVRSASPPKAVRAREHRHHGASGRLAERGGDERVSRQQDGAAVPPAQQDSAERDGQAAVGQVVARADSSPVATAAARARQPHARRRGAGMGGRPPR